MLWMLLMYSMYFVAVTLLFQLLVKHGLAALPCKRLGYKRLFVHYSYTTPHLIKCFRSSVLGLKQTI